MQRGLLIQLFGSAEFLVLDKAVTTKLSAKSLAILVFLLCHEQHRATREKLASMFWSESFDTATYNLRYNLWNIKKVIPPDENGEDFLITSKDFCAINPAYQYTSDLNRLNELLQVPISGLDRKALLEIMQILEQEFLEEFYIRNCDEFNDWVLFERTRYQKLAQQVQERLYESYMAEQNLPGAENALCSLLRINPYEERYYCRMIELCVRKGERHSAIRWYKSCEELLRKDLNLAPSKQLRELYLELTAQEDHSDAPGEEQRHLVIRLSAWEDTNAVSGALLADLIEQMLSTCDRTVASKIPKIFLEDLSSVQPILIPAYGLDGTYHKISQIRFLNSLRGVLIHLSHTYQITLQLDNLEQADPFSRTAIQYLHRMCPAMFECSSPFGISDV